MLHLKSGPKGKLLPGRGKMVSRSLCAHDVRAHAHVRVCVCVSVRCGGGGVCARVCVCQNDILDWVNTPSLDNCFGLVGHHQQGAECDLLESQPLNIVAYAQPLTCGVCVCVCVCVSEKDER